MFGTSGVEDRVSNMSSTALSLVCPVYNEGENIRAVVEGVSRCVSTPCELVLVYDFDEDNTIAPAAQAAADCGIDLVLCKNTYGKGVVGAIKTGIESARAPAIAVIMGDCSDDLSAVDVMHEKITSGADLVCGSRYMRGGRQIGAPPLKAFLSRMAGLSLHALVGLPSHDATNNFKMYDRRFLRATPIESRAGFEIGLELTAKAFVTGFKVTEVPVTWTERDRGTSRFRLLNWLPHYLRWYVYALIHARRKAAAVFSPPSGPGSI